MLPTQTCAPRHQTGPTYPPPPFLCLAEDVWWVIHGLVVMPVVGRVSILGNCGDTQQCADLGVGQKRARGRDLLPNHEVLCARKGEAVMPWPTAP